MSGSDEMRAGERGRTAVLEGLDELAPSAVEVLRVILAAGASGGRLKLPRNAMAAFKAATYVADALLERPEPQQPAEGGEGGQVRALRTPEEYAQLRAELRRLRHGGG